LPTGRRGQLLAVGLLLLVLVSAFFLVVAPLVELYQQREASLDDGRMLLPRLQAAAARLPTLRARVAELQLAARAQSYARWCQRCHRVGKSAESDRGARHLGRRHDR
jgi:type II secretory pathway component PulM